MDDGLDRRRFLAVGAVGLTASVAGCNDVLPTDSSSDDEDGGDDEDTSTPTATRTPTATPSPTPTPGPTPLPYGDTVQNELTETDETDLYFAEDGVFYADRYVFEGSADDPMAVTMTSDAFDARLRLVAPDGATVATNAQGPEGVDARIGRYLGQDGEYTVWATANESEATGSYRLALQRSEELVTDPNDLRSVAYGQSRDGHIDEDDPTDPEYDGAYYAEPVAFQAEEGDRVEITMASDDFDPWIRLADPNEETVTSDNDSASGSSALVSATLTTGGEYTIWCQSYDENQTGDYTVTLEKTGTAEDGADLRSLSYGDTAEGYIDYQDPVDDYYSGEYYSEPVTFTGSSGDEVEIAMESDEVDPWLRLESPSGTTVEENDDGAGGLDAAISTVLSEDGEYTIWTRTYGEGATGPYTLTLEKLGEVEEGPDLRSIAYGESREGFVDQSDPTDPEYSSNYYAEPVTFQGEANDEIEITMASESFAPFVRLAGPEGSSIDSAGDSNSDTPATLTTTLQSDGEYTIWCQTYEEDRFGAYSLAVEKVGETTPTATPAADGADLRSIGYGDTEQGFVDLDDPTDPEYSDDYYAEPVTFDGEDGDEIEISMDSDDFDPWIRLADPDEETVDADGGGGPDEAASLSTTLTASGEYTIWCQTYEESQTGVYTLSLELIN